MNHYYSTKPIKSEALSTISSLLKKKTVLIPFPSQGLTFFLSDHFTSRDSGQEVGATTVLRGRRDKLIDTADQQRRKRDIDFFRFPHQPGDVHINQRPRDTNIIWIGLPVFHAGRFWHGFAIFQK